MPGMEINLGFSGLSEAVNRLREMERLTSQIARNQQGGGGGGSASAGPMARLGAARGGLSSALASGEPSAIFDAQVRAIRAEQSVARAQRLLGGPPGVGQRLMTAVSTSRFGAGGVMPLVGRTAAVLGGEAMAGPIGLAVAGAAAAISAFSTIMHDATQSVGEFRRAASVTGGTAGQTAQLGAMGIAPGQQGSVAARLQETLSTNAQAIMFSQRFLGIGPQAMRGFGSNPNEAQQLTRFLSELRDLQKRSPQQALTVARQFGMEEFLDRLAVSDPVWKELIQSADRAAEVNKKYAGSFRDLEGETSRVATAFDAFKASIGGTLAPATQATAGALADLLENLTAFREARPGFQWQDLFKLPGQDIAEALAGGKGGTPEEKAAAATQKNTEALEGNTRLLQQGIMGGGPLAQGAVPVHFRGVGVAEALKGDRLKLGIFGN